MSRATTIVKLTVVYGALFAAVYVNFATKVIGAMVYL